MNLVTKVLLIVNTSSYLFPLHICFKKQITIVVRGKSKSPLRGGKAASSWMCSVGLYSWNNGNGIRSLAVTLNLLPVFGLNVVFLWQNTSKVD